MKTLLLLLAILLTPFTNLLAEGGYIKVSSGITAPATITRGENFQIAFKIKETKNLTIVVQELALALHNSNGAFVADLKNWTSSTYCSFAKLEEKSFSFSTKVSNSSVSAAGAYKLVLKLKMNGSWLQINTTGNGVNPKNIRVELPTPVISVSPTNLNFGSVYVGESKTLSYTLSATNLTDNIKVTAPEGYMIKAESSNWGPTLTVPPSSNGSVNLSVSVRFSPSNSTPYNGVIKNSSTSATNKSVNVAGDGISIPTYNIQISASPSQGGAVSGGGSFTQGTVCTVQAAANPGYIFEGWYVNGLLESTASAYSFSVVESRYMIARFTQEPVSNFTVTVQPDPVSGGSVNGGGIFLAGNVCNLAAIPAETYQFVGWYEGEMLISSNQFYSFTVTRDVFLTAKFIQNQPTTFYVGCVLNPSTGGSFTGSGHYLAGSVCQLIAIPSTTYEFVGWFDGSNLRSSNSEYSFQVTKNEYLTAMFRTISSPECRIFLAKSGDGEGSVYFNGLTVGLPCTLTVIQGETVTLSNIPASTSLFWGWEGDLTGTENPSVFEVIGNMNINVRFEITVDVDQEEYKTPDEFTLEQNYPNPFNPSTVIRYALPVTGFARISVYNAVGELVKVLVSGEMPAGQHTVSFDAGGLPSGLYLYRLETEGSALTRKMLLVK